MKASIHQGIETRYVAPGNVRGARVSARCDAKRIYVPWDHALNVEDNHRAAARALQFHMGWTGQLQGCSIPSLKGGYAWVILD